MTSTISPFYLMCSPKYFNFKPKLVFKHKKNQWNIEYVTLMTLFQTAAKCKPHSKSLCWGKVKFLKHSIFPGYNLPLTSIKYQKHKICTKHDNYDIDLHKQHIFWEKGFLSKVHSNVNFLLIYAAVSVGQHVPLAGIRGTTRWWKQSGVSNGWCSRWNRFPTSPWSMEHH